MKFPWTLTLLTLVLVALAAPALAQGINPYNVTWAALNPGNDWSAQILQSIFPTPGSTVGTSPGAETTVISLIVGQFTGFVGAVACAFLAYNVIINIHRAAESSRILGNNQSWMFVVRVGFAGIMMFPLGGGFSAGQAFVMQGAMVGAGMAKALYQNAVQAVGPDAMVIAQPMIPGTGNIVAGLINSELCMDLVDLASGTMMNETNGTIYPVSTWLVPPPTAISVSDGAGGGSINYDYAMTEGNNAGDPVCGAVGVDEAEHNEQPIAGVTIDMATVQQAVLNNVLTGSIRQSVQTVAENLWVTKNASALSPLDGIYTTAVNAYTSELTSAATSIRASVNAALQNQATQERAGASNLLTGEQQQSNLGWTAAGAYYLQIAQANASTLSLLQDTPITTPPTYEGLGSAIYSDLAPLEGAANSFMATLSAMATTSDPTQPPTGTQTLAGATNDQANGVSLITKLVGDMHLSNTVLQEITSDLLPTAEYWTDPFGGLMALGQLLIITSLIAMGTAAFLASAPLAYGSAVLSFFTGNWGAAATTVAGHAVMNFLATPIFVGLLALMTPGIIIAYVLPMIPWIMWMAGVCGWLILVCEAMIAVPLWMLAHMTFGGDGLHGRAIEGWGLLFNVVFRPVLMVIGLFLGYFIFDAMSWLIRETFGVATAFTLDNGWLVTNFIGIGVLLWIFVMTHVIAALMSFRLVALLPHHLPRLLGFTAANRVDMDDFQQQAAYVPGGQVAGGTARALEAAGNQFTKSVGQGNGEGAAKALTGPTGQSTDVAMDSTLRATSGSQAVEGNVDDI